MIQAVIGLPGSGKTTVLSALADKAVAHKPLRFGGVVFGDNTKIQRVYSTFPCKNCYKLDFDTLGTLNYHDCLILIDEVQLLCDSRNFKSFGDNLKFFFALHRHYNITIVWASQSYSDADAKIRRLTTDYFLCEKSFFNLSRITPIEQYLGVDKGSINERYYLGGFFRSGFINRKKYYNLFDSHEQKPLPEVQSDLWSAAEIRTLE